MNVKILILGRPGSGKSTVACHLKHFFALRGYLTKHINDYGILKQMFLEDVEHKKFLPTANNGFDAIDLSVLDCALQEVELRVEQWLPVTNIITIEFARDDYSHALQQFTPDFLQNAYILFMDADLEMCLRRVNQRVAYSQSADDHPSFSSAIFRSYYSQDNKPYIATRLQQEFKLKKLVQLINNTGPLEDCMTHIEKFARLLLERENDVQSEKPALAC